MAALAVASCRERQTVGARFAEVVAPASFLAARLDWLSAGVLLSVVASWPWAAGRTLLAVGPKASGADPNRSGVEPKPAAACRMQSVLAREQSAASWLPLREWMLLGGWKVWAEGWSPSAVA